MIIHKLDMGRLGNQLFQIAAATGAAQKNNSIACFPKWKYNDFFETGINDNLNTEYDAIFEGRLHETHYGLDFHYNEIPNKKDLILVGFYQSEKYFKPYSYEIKRIFNPTDKNLKQIQQLRAEYPYKSTCAIHVRRGDYLLAEDCHPDISKTSYYKQAIEMSGCKNFVVFSDDIAFCRDYFKNLPGNYFYSTYSKSDIEDLFLMANFKNMIIANSSFSWWASWFSNNMFYQKENYTMAPRKWFGPKLNYDTKDLYLNYWIKL